MKVYDLIILGAGPAGITASIYAARKRLDFLTISLDIGGQAAWSGDIENYTGYQFISGPELTLKFEEHLKNFDIQLNLPERAEKISKENNLIKTITDKQTYLSKTLIIATGKKPKRLNVPGEEEFKNRGVSYCATCDAPLFKNKNVAIIGGGNSALDAALQLLKISPKIYIINIAAELTGDAVMQEKIKNSNKVEIWNNSRLLRIYGERFVKGVELEREGQIHHLKIEGVFIEAGLIPNSNLSEEINKNELGEIVVDCNNCTNVEGIFAAGDVTNVAEKQIIVACGEGAKASLSAFRYLSGKRW